MFGTKELRFISIKQRVVDAVRRLATSSGLKTCGRMDRLQLDSDPPMADTEIVTGKGARSDPALNGIPGNGIGVTSQT